MGFDGLRCGDLLMTLAAAGFAVLVVAGLVARALA